MTETRIKRKYVRKNAVIDPAQVEPSMYTINERFEFVSQMVMMLASGDQASVVLTGPGGLGKSHTVMQSLIKSGYDDLSGMDIELENYPDLKVFSKVSGYSTPKGLYKELYDNRFANCVIVFDDIDNILQNDVSVNLLKAALDSYSTRIISWKSRVIDEDLPSSFEFKGKVVFISNMSSARIDQAILSRSLTVDLSMTNVEKIDRMKHLLAQDDFMPEYETQFKNEALALIETVKDKVRDLSLRTLIQVTKIRASNPDGNWKALSTYVMVG